MAGEQLLQPPWQVESQTTSCSGTSGQWDLTGGDRHAGVTAARGDASGLWGGVWELSRVPK